MPLSSQGSGGGGFPDYSKGFTVKPGDSELSTFNGDPSKVSVNITYNDGLASGKMTVNENLWAQVTITTKIYNFGGYGSNQSTSYYTTTTETYWQPLTKGNNFPFLSEWITYSNGGTGISRRIYNYKLYPVKK